MIRTLGVIAAAGAVAVALPVAAGGTRAPAGVRASSAPLANSQVFQDSIGENSAAPDIQTITVSNDDSGLITFQVKVPNRPSLTGDMVVDILADTDNNPQTGDAQLLGADYAIELFQNSVNMFRWDGSNFSTSGGVPQTSLAYAWASGVLTIKVSAAELGNTKHFNFAVDIASGVSYDPSTGNIDFTNAQDDVAPDPGHGFYGFDVKIGKLKLVVKKFSLSPARPAAGHVFSAFLVGVRSDTGATLKSGQVACAASVGGKRLRARTHAVVNGRAKCTWSVPASAKGRRIHGTVTVHFEGLTAKKSFSAVVR
jgi:hypothetical protein